MKNYNNEILNDCSWFAEKHRGKNKLSGAHWSTIIRFPKLYDEAIRLQHRVDTLEDYIADYCSPIISDKYSETDTRVRCTKDGDYPEDKETVFAEIHGQYYDGITHKLDFDKDNGLWLDYDGENIPHTPEEMTVYWQ